MNEKIKEWNRHSSSKSPPPSFSFWETNPSVYLSMPRLHSDVTTTRWQRSYRRYLGFVSGGSGDVWSSLNVSCVCGSWQQKEQSVAVCFEFLMRNYYMCTCFVVISVALMLCVRTLPPAGASGSLLWSGRSEETFLLRLQETHGGKHGAALWRSDPFNHLHCLHHLSMWRFSVEQHISDSSYNKNKNLWPLTLQTWAGTQITWH